MKQKRKKITLLSCLIISVLTLISCGGGGGSASPQQPQQPAPQQGLSRDNAASVSGAVITSIRLITDPSYTGTASVSAEVQQAKIKALPFLQSLYNEAAGHIRTSNIQRTAQGAIDRTTNCTVGGTRKEVSQWTGNDTNPQNYTGTITYTNCKEGTETWNGTVAIIYEGSSHAPMRVTTTLNSMAYTDTAANTNLTLTGMTIVYSDITYDGNLEVVSASTVMSGSITGTFNGKSINAGYDGFKMAYGFQGNGLNIQISGKINPVCLNKWLTTATPVTVSLNIANSCPSGGVITISDETSAAKMMSFTAQGGLVVSFNNETAATYTDCSAAEGLCR